MTRVLIMEGSGNLWGSERALLDLLDGLHDVEVAVCCPPNVPLIPELIERHRPVLPYYVYGLHEKSRWARLLAVAGVVRALLTFRPDLIYLNQSGGARIVALAARPLGIPLMTHVRIFEDAAYLARLHPSPNWLRGIIAISHAIHAELLGHPALRQIPIHTLYDAYALQADLRRPEASAVGSLHQLVCVGRLVPIKGQDVLLRALGILHGRGIHLDCLMIGDGDQAFKRALRAQVETEGLQRLVNFTGFTQDVMEVLRCCRILVCPSHREPLGRVVFEAWDAGCLPVVFAGSGGAAEVVKASGGGILYPQQDPDVLADVLQMAIDLSPVEIAHLVSRGRQWLRENCSVRQYGDQIRQLFIKATRGPCRS